MDARKILRMLRTVPSPSRQRFLCRFFCKVPQHFSSHIEERPDHFSWAKGGGWVHKLATIHSSTTVEIGAVIHEHVQVGPHSRIGSGSILGPHVIIGSHSLVWYNVSLQNTCIGDHCIIHCGACVGQDGFGFFVDDQGEIVKKPQIGHNVVIGHSCMICGQVGLGGSSTVGDYVVLGGKAGVADHVCIASKVRIAAKSGVTHNITEPGDYAGFPAVPAAKWRKNMVGLRKLGQGP